MSIAKANRRTKKTGRRGPRYWIVAVTAAGAIIAFTVGNSRAMNVTYAAVRNGELVAVKAGDEFSPIEFNIPAGTIEDVIAAYQKKTGIEINAENTSILSIGSPGVVGNFTAEQALKQMLRGTGVSYVFVAPRGVLLGLQAESASVVIKGSDAKIIDSPKYDAPLRDIPQTLNVVSKEMIEQQGATTLRDVLSNVPGITMTAGEGGAPAGDNLTIRGFSARNDIFVDGVRDLGPQSRDPFDLEQVEVVKGPNSTFTGRGSTGGTINLISKLPNLRRSFAGSLTGGTDGTKRATADINLPITDSSAFRLNLMGHDSNFPGREVVQNRRWGAAPSVIFGLGTATRIAASYFYIEQDNTSDYGIPWVPAANTALIEYRDRPAPVPHSTFYGFLDRDKEKLRSDLFTARLEHEFNDVTTVRSQFRYGYSRRDSIATPPRFTNNTTTSINREMRSWMTRDDIFDDQTDLTTKFKTGFLEHSLVFGASYSYEKNHRVLRTGENAQTSLFDPDPRDIYTGTMTIDPREPDARAISLAGYFFDSVRINKKLQAVGGLRWDRFDVSGQNTATVNNLPVMVPIDRVDMLVSGRASLVFKPVEIGTIYASYSSSANPSLEGLLYSPADIRTDPETSRTFEIGSKWDLFGNKLLVSGALFRVEKNNARTAGLLPGDPPTLDGDQAVQGIEFSATGNITRNWQIFAGYTFLDSKTVRSNTAPTNVNGLLISEVGKELINTPRNSFNLWTTYIWNKLFFGGGPRFVDKRYGNNINTRVVDSYVVVDALLSYKLTKNIDLRLNMNNIGDKYYIDRIGGGHIVPGAGRVVLLGTAFNF
ncbi:MAG TPA: TonB-dependent siderophore receptor [Pyrinomonadaceae bacterium]|nr:TonB-dependent siderophore receptor [Pyrinomonadaceae bacterium]